MRVSTRVLETAIHAHEGRTEGQQLRYCGVGAGFDDVIIDGNPDEMKVRLRVACIFSFVPCAYHVRAVCCILHKGREGRRSSKVPVYCRVPSA